MLPVTLPPLRQRRDDLPALIAELLRAQGIREPGPLEGSNLAKLAQHRWPGNVRELRNVIERAVVRAGAGATFGQLTFELSEREVARDERRRRFVPGAQARGDRSVRARVSRAPMPQQSGNW